MSKEKDLKSEIVPSAPQPDLADVLKALMAQVAKLSDDVASLKAVPAPQVVPVPAAPATQPVVNRPGIEANRGYVRVSKGFPMQPGQTWHDMTHEQRRNYMLNHENRWKGKFTQSAQRHGGGSANWSQGEPVSVRI